MTYKIRTAAVLGVILSLLGLAACGTAAPSPTPTLDLNPFRTEVAATVLAQVTHDLALTPSITPVPTLTATQAPTATASETPPGTAASTPGTPTAGPSPTPSATLTNLAAWVSQSIPDDTVFKPGETFTITWTLKNSGAATWAAGYLLRFYSGDRFGAPAEILIGQEVPPGSTVELSIPMTAPGAPGNYRTDWVLSDLTRANFKEPVFLKFSVAAPPTSTRPATAAPSATSGP